MLSVPHRAPPPAWASARLHRLGYQFGTYRDACTRRLHADIAAVFGTDVAQFRIASCARVSECELALDNSSTIKGERIIPPRECFFREGAAAVCRRRSVSVHRYEVPSLSTSLRLGASHLASGKKEINSMPGSIVHGFVAEKFSSLRDAFERICKAARNIVA
jgi:hypothetical protein